VDDSDVPGWYHAADAFAFPSVNEGFGLAVLEALATGTPTVVADLPVFREYLEYERDVLVVAPGDDKALADRLHLLATDASARRKLAESGQRVAARHTWAESARRHLDVYRSIGVSI